MPKVSPEQLAATRQAILEAARRAFARHGYEGATVRVLEAETGLSRGAIFHHFKDKDALFLALAEDDAAQMTETVAQHGLVQVMRDLQAEVFTGNPDAYAPATLARVAEKLGIPVEETREMLDSDKYADAVRADHAQAVRLGARGVPFTVLGGRMAIPGAVTADQFLAVIDQAWEQVDG